MKRLLGFLSDGISVDETKFSVLIVLTIVYAIFILVLYCMKNDISSNLVLVFQTLITAIAGINVAESISSNIGGNNKL